MEILGLDLQTVIASSGGVAAIIYGIVKKLANTKLQKIIVQAEITFRETKEAKEKLEELIQLVKKSHEDGKIDKKELAYLFAQMPETIKEIDECFQSFYDLMEVTGADYIIEKWTKKKEQ